MGIPAELAKYVKKLLAARGYALTRLRHVHRPTMGGALRAIAERHHGIGTVIDIGASDGRWSETAMGYLPKASYFLIEAQETHSDALQRFCSAHPEARFTIAAAGESAGTVYFKANRPLGGQAALEPSDEHDLAVPVVAVDDEVERLELRPPFLLKLDTHGFEVPILDGARRTLERTEALVIEAYNFRLTPDCLLFHELCDRLASQGFRCIDLVDVRHRQRDQALWQMNLVFARADREEFRHSTFR